MEMRREGGKNRTAVLSRTMDRVLALVEPLCATSDPRELGHSTTALHLYARLHLLLLLMADDPQACAQLSAQRGLPASVTRLLLHAQATMKATGYDQFGHLKSTVSIPLWLVTVLLFLDQ
jgi:hypothetical protein